MTPQQYQQLQMYQAAMTPKQKRPNGSSSALDAITALGGDKVAEYFAASPVDTFATSLGGQTLPSGEMALVDSFGTPVGEAYGQSLISGDVALSTPSSMAPAASGWALEGIGSAGNFIAPVAGAVGVVDLLANKRRGTRGLLQGIGSGAALGSYFGPVGIGVGAVLGGGASLLNKKPKTRKEDSRYKKLQESGVRGFESPFKATDDKNAWFRGDLGEDFIGYDPRGQWVNNKFSKSRNKKDLRPQDIVGYSAFGERYGDEWFGKLNEKQRTEAAQAVLDSDAANEHHGTIDIDWSKIDPKRLPGAPTPEPKRR